jgi:chaperonin GroES
MAEAQELPFPRCIGDRLLVQPLEVDKTVGGMTRPGAENERPAEGIVVLVGPGRVTEFGHRIQPEISAGDLISFPSYAGKEIVDPRGFAEGTYLIVRQDEVQINYGPHQEPPEAFA